MAATVETQLEAYPVSILGAAPNLNLYPDGSDTAAQSSVSMTESTNRKGYYSSSVTGLSGLHYVRVLDADGNQIGAGWVMMALAGRCVVRDTRREALEDRVVGQGIVTSGATTTSIPTSSCSPAGASTDQFKGRVLLFANDTATAALRGQGAPIDGSTNAAAPTFTLDAADALNTVPASGDRFLIL